MNQNLLYLNSPSRSEILPPINGTIDELPLEQLTWEDFERLCLRIVQIQYTIQDCEIFGMKGQAQEGIDIYAKKTSGKYAAYQCKRYQSVSPSIFENAVNEFLNGEWADKIEEFTFMATSPMNDTNLQLKFEQLKANLGHQNILLLKLDKTQICRTLKNHAGIVYDFFGKEWARLFNGEDKLLGILHKRKPPIHIY